LCNGETPLPRRRHHHPALALAALATALVSLAATGDARAQSSITSPFQPFLTDPRNPQRFSPPDAAIPSKIVPPSGAGEFGFRSTGPVRRRTAKKKPGDPRPLPPPPPLLAGAHGNPPQLKARATYADAFKPPDAPVRRPLLPTADAFEPLGVRVGTFVVKPAVEINRGYDTNPSHVPGGAPSAFTLVEPTLKVLSNWSRHETGLDLRGSFSEYDKQSSLNRPLLDVKTHSRIDVSHDTIINTESRYYLSTDYPGSPNLPVGFAKLPIFETYGTTAAVTQRFNRLELTAKASTDRTQYQNTQLVDGSSSSNTDRNFDQYAGAARASYELLPGVKPFIEIGGDVRKHDLQFDRDGFQRDSHAIVPRVGSTIELPRRLTGEISVGYLTRTFADPTLPDLTGVVADASLIWAATGLTTATLTATSRAEETVLAGVSGALRRDIAVQIDHALRRWLIWSVRVGYGLDDYVGSSREDNRMSFGTALTYKLSREVWLKGEYHYDQMKSTEPGVPYSANAVLIGLKLQR
jgi:hypothetical protein